MDKNQYILVFTSGYGVSANGICAEALVKEMEKHGARVFVISFDSEKKSYASENIFSVLNTSEEKRVATGFLGKSFNLLKDVLLHTRGPKINDAAVTKAVNTAKKLYDTTPFDKVVSVYFPVEAVVSAYRLKKQLNGLKFVIYELDSVADGILGSSKYSGYIVNSYRRLLRRIYKSADLIMVHKSHEACWLKEHQLHKSKLQLTDLPILCKACETENRYEKTEEYKFVYGGTLDADYRSPQKMLESFEKIGKLPYVIDFYSKGCESILRSNTNLNICIRGYVSKEEFEKAVLEADFLLSIGNAVSNSLPSKIITYISYGKPIIHFSLQENDVCAEYLAKYPLSFVINKDSEADDDLRRFIEENRGRTLSFSEVCDLFPMNLPEYSVKRILEQ